MTYETWILQLKMFLMKGGFMCWDDATQFLSMFDLRRTWDSYQWDISFYDKYTRI